MDIIYPPYIEGILPAFKIKKDEDKDETTVTIVVPYKRNPAVAISSIQEFSLIIKNINSNRILTTQTSNVIDKNNIVQFTLTKSTSSFFPEVGQYYKLQIAYVGKGQTDNLVYSTTGVVKCIKDYVPSLKIFGNNIVFSYSNKEAEENLYKYYLNIYENDKLVKTEEVLATDQLSYHHHFYFMPETTYRIEISYITVNLFVDTIRISNISYVNPITIKTQKIQYDYDKGIVIINIVDLPAPQGVYHIYRSKEGSNEQELLAIKNSKDATLYYEDNTIEHGAKYTYYISSSTDKYSNLVQILETETVYFEDMYLSDNEKTLKIRFNPKISSLKNVIQEAKTETIGSRYPFFFRNGAINYKEFPLNGLISYLQDEEEKFMTKEELGLEIDSLLRKQTTGNRAAAANTPTTSLTNYNIEAERRFKNAVLEWLTNGKPKLLKTPTEGTYIVYLMNVSLSPEEQLGRMLHSFQATAYEMADFNLSNCHDLHLVPQPVNVENITISTNNQIIKQSNVESFSSKILYNVTYAQISGFNGEIKIDDGETITTDSSETITIEKYVSKLDLSGGTGGNIIYIQPQQIAVYSLQERVLNNESETNMYVKNSSEFYIAKVELTAPEDSDGYYYLSDEEIDDIPWLTISANNTVVIDGITSKVLYYKNCNGSLLVLVEDTESNGGILSQYQESEGASTLIATIYGGSPNGNT